MTLKIEAKRMTLKIEAKDAVSALNELSEMGFTHDFRIQGGKLVDVSTGLPVDPAAVAVVAKLRFETDAGSGDASNIYALDVDNGTARGFLVDALDFEGEGAPGDLIDKLRAGAIASVVEGSNADDLRYGVRKVRKTEFNADPARYVLRVGYPDFPACPFGQGFTMLGYDTTDEEYVWLATKVLKDDRLQHVPYNGSGRA